MKLATCEQSRQIDLETQKQGLSGEVLMENAARASFESLTKELEPSKSILVLCGPGNNGGDGLALARLLWLAQFKVTLTLVAEKGSPLFDIQLKRCRDLKIPVTLWRNFKHQTYDVIIDALFGVGLARPLEGDFAAIVDWTNRQSSLVVSLDIPSGLDGDRGVVLGHAVRAKQTHTYGLAKPGFFVHHGPEHVGDLKIFDIGFPADITARIATSYALYSPMDASADLPQRAETSNKANHGHALVIAGRSGTWGAAVLATEACFRTGVGYVTLASHEDMRSFVPHLPEVMTADLNHLWQKEYTAIAIGSGLGADSTTENLVRELKTRGFEKVVVDADAFTVSAKLLPLPASWVVTPHAGELARIIGWSAKDIEENRFAAAREAHQKIGCHIVLKGLHTVLYDGQCFHIINSGNAALAKAGTGDVLTGIITGFLAQKPDQLSATRLGIFVHGFCADQWVAQGLAQASFQASDLVRALPAALGLLERQKTRTRHLQLKVSIANLAALKKWVEGWAQQLRAPSVICLTGELGAGKTQLVQFLNQALQNEEVAQSPTFGIHHEYSGGRLRLSHVDLYRLENEDDLESTGFWDLFHDTDQLLAIEWAERLRFEWLPRHWPAWLIDIKKTSAEGRELICEFWAVSPP